MRLPRAGRLQASSYKGQLPEVGADLGARKKPHLAVRLEIWKGALGKRAAYFVAAA
jgi:hypothetical protein